MEKANRNDPCPCGSGQKFKKCCATKSPLKKLNATLLSSERVTQISSLFPKKPSEVDPTSSSH